MSRTAVAILSTENLIHNVNIIKKKIGNSKIIGMLKANAYGHGLRSMALRLEQKVDMIGVASIDEALALRKIGIKTPIILMEGTFEQNELIIAATQQLHLVFHSKHQLDWLDKLPDTLSIYAWLKIDTGMGRLGFAPNQALQAYKKLVNHERIQHPIGIMSHLACANSPKNKLNKIQIERFEKVVAQFPNKHKLSLCNSAGIFCFPKQHYHYVRPGISLFGITPFTNYTATELGLKPVMTLQSSLIAIKTICKGETIGYNANYICDKDTLVGIIAFGYGDGYPRTARNGTPVLINKIKCPLIGQISMDMLAVDLTQCPNTNIGDPVTLWGNGLPIEEIALYTENTPYELLTGVQHRVKFHWTKPIQQENHV